MAEYCSILTRHPANPIISPTDFPYGPADVVFNCGQTMHEGKTLLLIAVILRNHPRPRIHVAESEDGVHFEIREEPFITQLEEEPFRSLDGWPIDPRLTKIGDTYYIIRPGNSAAGCIAFLEKTRDFRTREFVDIVALPNNRVPSLFPEKIGGCYARLDRPYNHSPTGYGVDNEMGNIWLSYSPDLVHWGRHRFVLGGWTHWNWRKIGPTPPIKTERGWLEIIHGVVENCSTTRYSLGAVLLDQEDPSRVLGKMNSYILTPETDYETSGRVPDVVFACGAIGDLEARRLRIYYGAADTRICLAEGDLDEIIDGCLNGL
jgi:beta-1,4-mannooligosaccharide/beta-1,4-mannosyl-N-acetylglucosamine phosphorylase